MRSDSAFLEAMRDNKKNLGPRSCLVTALQTKDVEVNKPGTLFSDGSI